ncbi:hypothetical protein CHUAL_012823 [Chamberlinius hualienensis]
MAKMLWGNLEILSQPQLRRLGEHKYSCTSTSFMDKLMQSYWNWLVEKLPMWLAPNLITIAGLIVNIVTSLILVLYSPNAREDIPRWACFLAAVGLFIYQSLDAVDGKQARRTGTSSPLGELFDHGCDSISTVVVGIGACVSVQLGTNTDWMFFQVITAITLFYSAHWQTYVSGTLRFGKFDVTEAQFGVIALQLVSATFGTSVWSLQIPGFNLELKYIPAFVIFLGSVVGFFRNFVGIFTAGAGKNGSTVADTSILSPFIPISLVIVPAFIIYRKSISNLYETYPCLYLIAFGLAMAKVTNRLVVAHMTKSEMDYLDPVLVGPGMLFLNQYFNTAINEHIILWLCLLWVIFDLIRYSTVVCNQICRHLNICLFVIPTNGSKPSSFTHSTQSPHRLLQMKNNISNKRS